MKGDQRTDLIAEADWEVCQQGRWNHLWSATCTKHWLDGKTDLGRGHYDTHFNSACIPVREVFKIDGDVVYQDRKWPKVKK